jgi:hypothetical protein
MIATIIFPAVHVERTTVTDKRGSVELPYEGGGYCASASIGHATPVYFIFVMTAHGDLRITVSRDVFNLLEVGDPIVVQYQKRRCTDALKGKIAR